VELALALSPAFADRSSGRDRCSAVPAVVERGGAIRITLVTSFLPIIQRYKRDNPSALGHTPKPDGGMEGFRFLEVLYDCRVGHRTGGSRGSGWG
jgi:hypothetical protein